MDTVIIKIYGPGRFRIRSHALFLPELKKRSYGELSDSEKRSNRPYLRRFLLKPEWRPTYLPSIELFEALTENKGDIRYILKVQLSVPKLLYGNSLEECVESDRDRVYARLKTALASVRIFVEEKDIANANVSAVHFCKNLPLPKGMNMREIQSELAKLDVSKAEDVSDKQIKNGGRLLNIFSGTVEHVFYEKVSDCLRPKNKRADKGFIDPERDVVTLNGLQDREVFRYEYRLKKTQTVRREINRALERDATMPVYFRDLFSPDLYKTMMQRAWRSLLERPENQLSLFGESSRLRVFLHVLGEAKKQGGQSGHSMNKGFTAYGIAMAVRDHGAKEVKGVVAQLWSDSHPERFGEKLNNAVALTEGLGQSTNIAFIENALVQFKKVDIEGIKNGLHEV